MILSLIAGLALLALGGELLVRGAVGLAQRLGVSPLLAGLVIVGFGTSTPELATSVQAAWAGSPGIAMGNVIGSNIANILLILGLSALVLPLAVNRAAFRRDAIALGGSTILCVAAVLLGTVGRMSGAVLVACLAGYLIWAYRSERAFADAEGQRHEAEAADTTPAVRGLVPLALMVVAGLAAAIFGAGLLVDAAIALAGSLGMSEAVIGLTVVAVGTSLPELIACLIAVARKHADVALGNIVGSNIYNVLGILGTTALIQPLSVPPELAQFDIWVLLGVTALLIAQLRSGWTVSRAEGGLLFALFVGYTAFLVMR